MSKLYDTIIIGAGLSGLYLYQELKSKGKNVLVLEKSRNIGGRIAQRRFDGHTFEMGAENYPDVPLEQWRSLILKNKGIRKQSLVEKVGIQNNIIQVHADKLFKAKTVVICAPAPQAFQLLRKSGLALYELNNVNYSMDIFYFTKNSKRILHKSLLEVSCEIKNEFYFQKFKLNEWDERPREKIKEELDNMLSPKESHCHKWRYSKVLNTINKRYQTHFKDRGVYLVGDYFIGSDFNSAIESSKNILPNLLS